MKILRFHRFGGPEVLKIEEEPEPLPGPRDVRVRAQAIGIGVPEVLMYSGKYPWCPPLPVVPGNELVGEVDAIGSEVTRFKEGDRVYVTAREFSQRGGCCVEAIVVDERLPYAIPETVPAEQAVGLGNLQVASMLLNHAASPQQGQSILVHAAAGGVGGAVVQLGKQAGLTVYGIAGGNQKAQYVADLGADIVIDRKSDDIDAIIAEHTGGKGVNVIYDSVAGPEFHRNFDRLGLFGIVVMFGFLAGHPDPNIYDPMRKHFGKSQALRLFSVHVLDDNPDLRRASMEATIAALATGDIAQRVHAKIALADAPDAFRMLEEGGVIGKLVLTP